VDVHELSITRSIVTAVSERIGDAKAKRLRLEIGKMSGVVADSVRFCFEIAAADTVLEGAELEIIETPGRAKCRECDSEFEMPDTIPLCHCGSADIEILDGKQLLIKEVELA
jgi:hydrogenase nickel incorporation protein HypA/HybF